MVSPLPDVSVRQWEYLVAVAHAPTWSAAAAEVGVSTSALSQGLAELERRLGVAVFERAGRRKVVAGHAVPVVDHARRVLALSGDLADWVARTRHGRAGRVQVGMIDVAALVHLAEPLRRFRLERPDVDLRLVVSPSAELLDQLRRGDLDLVVAVRDERPDPDLDVADLLTEALAIYGPADAAAGPLDTWGPWVLFPYGSRTRALVEAELRRRGARLDVVAESNQPEVLGEMVRLAIGWTVLPEAQAAGPEPLHRLVDEPLVHRGLSLHRRTGAIVAPAVDDLAAVLIG